MLVALIWPAATLVTVRSPPAEPTLTVPTGLLPAKSYLVPWMVVLAVPTGADTVEPLPNATEPLKLAPLAADMSLALASMLTLLPTTNDLSAEMVLLLPKA